MSEKKTNETKKSKELPVMPADTGAHQHNIPLLPPAFMDDTIGGVTSHMNDFVDVADNNLTDAQRKRKVGAGTRNYGFIDKVSDLAEANPQFVQFFRIADLKNCIRNVEMCRNLTTLLQGFARAATNTTLIYSDDAYSMALIFYNNVKELSRRGDPMAAELFRELKTYFKKTKSSSAKETEKELERNVRALARGKKDGKIEIENITPKLTGGVRKIVDDVHKDKTAFKESAEGEIDE